MLLVFIAPLLVVTIFSFNNYYLFLAMYVLCGFGMAGVGMGVMHDAIHGSYSKNQTVNRIMGYTINLIGGNKEVWRLQHNVLHHSYTNIEHHDDDINAPFFLRFSPHAKRNWLHRYQHIYVWVFYGMSTLSWVTVRDYSRFYIYFKMGLVKDRRSFTVGVIQMSLWKLSYFSITILFPFLFSSFGFGEVIVAFLVMHFVAGTSLTIIFQTAHVSEGNDFPLPNDNGNMETSLIMHQLETTCNFSMDNRILSWLVGGLTHQIEHHLFPHISHIHYREIAPIVKQTAEEYGVKYRAHESLFVAVSKHIQMLKDLGKKKSFTFEAN